MSSGPSGAEGGPVGNGSGGGGSGPGRSPLAPRTPLRPAGPAARGTTVDPVSRAKDCVVQDVLHTLEPGGEEEDAKSLEMPVDAFNALSRRVRRTGAHDLHSAERERLMRVAQLLRAVPRLTLLPPAAPRPVDVAPVILDLRLMPGVLSLQLSEWTAFYIRGLDVLAGLRSLHLDACSLHRLQWITRPGSCAGTDEVPPTLPADQRPVFTSMQGAAKRDRRRRLAAAPNSVAWPDLRSILARNCGIVDLTDSLASAPVLESLDVSFNDLTSLDGLPAGPALSALSASANPLGRVPEPVLCLDALRTLRLARCGLRSAGPIRHCFSVEHLDLAFNDFPDLACLFPLAALHNLRALCVFGAPLRCPAAAVDAAAAGRRVALDQASREAGAGEAAGDAAVAAAREAADCTLVPSSRRLAAAYRAPLLASLLARVLSPSAPLHLDGLPTQKAERTSAASAAPHVRAALAQKGGARRTRSLSLRTAVRARCLARWEPGRREGGEEGEECEKEEEEGAATGAAAAGGLVPMDPSSPHEHDLARSYLVWRRQPAGAVRGELEVDLGVEGEGDEAKKRGGGGGGHCTAVSAAAGSWREALYMSDQRVVVDFPLSALVGIGPAASVQHCAGAAARADPSPGTVDIAALWRTDLLGKERGSDGGGDCGGVMVVVFTAPEEPGRRLLRLLAPIAAQAAAALSQRLLQPKSAEATAVEGETVGETEAATGDAPVGPTAASCTVTEGEEGEETGEGGPRPVTPEGSPSARVSLRPHPSHALPPDDVPSACVYDADSLARSLAGELPGERGGEASAGLEAGGRRLRLRPAQPVWPRVLSPVHIPRRLAPLLRARHADMYLRECVFCGGGGGGDDAGSERGDEGKGWRNEPVCAVFEMGVTLWAHPGSDGGAGPQSPPSARTPLRGVGALDRAGRSASTSTQRRGQPRWEGVGAAAAGGGFSGARCASAHSPHSPVRALRGGGDGLGESPPRQEITRDPLTQAGVDPRVTLARATASDLVAALRPAVAHREPQAVVAVTGCWLLVLRWEPGAGKALETKPGLEVVLAARLERVRACMVAEGHQQLAVEVDPEREVASSREPCLVPRCHLGVRADLHALDVGTTSLLLAALRARFRSNTHVSLHEWAAHRLLGARLRSEEDHLSPTAALAKASPPPQGATQPADGATSGAGASRRHPPVEACLIVDFEKPWLESCLARAMSRRQPPQLLALVYLQRGKQFLPRLVVVTKRVVVVSIVEVHETERALPGGDREVASQPETSRVPAFLPLLRVERVISASVIEAVVGDLADARVRIHLTGTSPLAPKEAVTMHVQDEETRQAMLAAVEVARQEFDPQRMSAHRRERRLYRQLDSVGL